MGPSKNDLLAIKPNFLWINPSTYSSGTIISKRQVVLNEIDKLFHQSNQTVTTNLPTELTNFVLPYNWPNKISKSVVSCYR